MSTQSYSDLRTQVLTYITNQTAVNIPHEILNEKVDTCLKNLLNDIEVAKPKVEDFVCGKLTDGKMNGYPVGMIAALWEPNCGPNFRVYVFTDKIVESKLDLSRSINIANAPYWCFNAMRANGYIPYLKIFTLREEDNDKFINDPQCTLICAELGIRTVYAVNKLTL